MYKRLQRSRNHKIIGGVCGGFSDYFQVDPVIPRFLFIVATFAHGIGLLAYIVLWIITPMEPYEWEVKSKGDNPVDDDIEPENDFMTDSEKRRKRNQRNSFFGVTLIALGVFFLLDEFFPMFDFDLLWPLLLIGAGAYIIYRSFRPEKEEDEIYENS